MMGTPMGKGWNARLQVIAVRAGLTLQPSHVTWAALALRTLLALAALLWVPACTPPPDAGSALESTTITLPVGHYPCGVAVDSTRGRVYVANMGEGTVSVIDGVTHEVLDRLEAGGGTRDVQVDAETGHLLVANLAAHAVRPIEGSPLRLYRARFSIDVLDVDSGERIGRAEAGAAPWALAVGASGERLYVAHYKSRSLSMIDTATTETLATRAIGGVRLPHDLALDETRGRLYVSTSLQVGMVTLGAGPLLAIDAETLAVRRSVPVGGRAEVAVDPRTGVVYVAGVRRGSLLAVDGESGATLAVTNLGFVPADLAVDASHDRLYAADRGGKRLVAIDLDPLTVRGYTSLPHAPAFLAVDGPGGWVYASHPDADAVSAVRVVN